MVAGRQRSVSVEPGEGVNRAVDDDVATVDPQSPAVISGEGERISARRVHLQRASRLEDVHVPAAAWHWIVKRPVAGDCSSRITEVGLGDGACCSCSRARPGNDGIGRRQRTDDQALHSDAVAVIAGNDVSFELITDAICVCANAVGCRARQQDNPVQSVSEIEAPCDIRTDVIPTDDILTCPHIADPNAILRAAGNDIAFIGIERVIRTVCTDPVVAGGPKNNNTVKAVAEQRSARDRGADVIPRDNIVVTAGTFDLNPVPDVARNDISFLCVVDAVAIGSHAVACCSAHDPDTFRCVANRQSAGDVRADIVSDQNIAGCPGAGDDDAPIVVTGNQIPSARDYGAQPISGSSGANMNAIDGISKIGRSRHIGADVVAQNLIAGCTAACDHHPVGRVAADHVSGPNDRPADDSVCPLEVYSDGVG